MKVRVQNESRYKHNIVKHQLSVASPNKVI